MYGIEIEEWPARIAEVAMWLMDHQMNLLLSESFGTYYVRLPLRKSPHIHHGNALRTDWNDVLPGQAVHARAGQSAVRGAKYQTKAATQGTRRRGEGRQERRPARITSPAGISRPSKYIEGTRIPVAFVSTNSITQGEQVGVLWGHLLEHHGVSIHFAHRTFAWESEARGKAHVHVVIIGFGLAPPRRRRLFEYECIKGEPHERGVSNISPYLVEGPDVAITNRSTPLCDVPEIGIGNKPIDDGNYLFTDEEKDAFVKTEPAQQEVLPAVVRLAGVHQPLAALVPVAGRLPAERSADHARRDAKGQGGAEVPAQEPRARRRKSSPSGRRGSTSRTCPSGSTL